MDKLQKKVSIHALKIALLGALHGASPKPLNKFNLIGRPQQRGELESSLGIEFDAQARSPAAKAFDEFWSAGVGGVGRHAPGFTSAGGALSSRAHRPST